MPPKQLPHLRLSGAYLWAPFLGPKGVYPCHIMDHHHNVDPVASVTHSCWRGGVVTMNRFPKILSGRYRYAPTGFWDGCHRRSHHHEAKHPDAADFLQPLPEREIFLAHNQRATPNPTPCPIRRLMGTVQCVTQINRVLGFIKACGGLLYHYPVTRFLLFLQNSFLTDSQVHCSSFCFLEQCTEGIRSDQKNVRLTIPPFPRPIQAFAYAPPS
jgi:hypothetical protein